MIILRDLNNIYQHMLNII